MEPHDPDSAHVDELAVTRLIGGSVCHRFNNLLAVAEMCAMLGMDMRASDPEDVEEVREALGRMHESCASVRDLVALYGRFTAGELAPAGPDGIELGHALSLAHRLLEHRLLRNSLRWEAEPDGEPVRVPAPSSRLASLLCVLLGALASAERLRGATLRAGVSATESGEAVATFTLEGGDPPAGEALAQARTRTLTSVLASPERRELGLAGVDRVAREIGARLEFERDGDRLRIALHFPR